MAQRDDGLISESPCETGVEGRQRAGAPAGLGLWNDAAWIAVVLAFFAIQYRATVFLGRHWLFGDNSFQNFPWHYFVWDRVRHGGLADPCLEMSLGFPLLAEPQVQALYLFNTALWPIADPFVSFTLKLLLHMLAATIGMYVLARQLGRSPMASAAAAIVLGGGSFMVYRIVHAPLLFGLAWLPWIVLLFMRARLHGSRLAFIGLVGCCAMQVLSGQPQMAVYTFIAAVVITAGRRADADGESLLRWWAHTLGLITCGYIGGLIIAMVQVSPSYELYLYGPRAQAMDPNLARQFGCSLKDLAVNFLANATADWKFEKVAFPGSIAWVAIVAAFWRRDRLGRALLILVGLGLLLSWSDTNPLYDVITHLPIVSKLRAPGRYGLLIAIGGALLLAYLVDDIRQRRVRRPMLAVLGAIILLQAVALMTSHRLGLGPFTVDDPLGWQAPILLAALLASAVAALRPHLTPALPPALLVLAAVELVLFGVTEQPAVTKQEWLDAPDQRIYQVAAEHAAEAPGAFVRWRDGLPSNVSIYYGIPQTRCHTPMAAGELEALHTYFYGPNRPSLLAAFGVRWVATDDELARAEGLKPVERVGRWLLCENPEEPLRAYIPTELIPGDFPTAMQVLRDRRADPRRTVVVPPDIIGSEPISCPEGEAEVLEDSPGRMVVRTRVAQPGLLVVTRLWTPHWSASVDGQSMPTTRAYSYLLATPVTPGEHTVVLDYQMPLVEVAGVSIAATLGWFVWLLIELRRRRRTPAAP